MIPLRKAWATVIRLHFLLVLCLFSPIFGYFWLFLGSVITVMEGVIPVIEGVIRVAGVIRMLFDYTWRNLDYTSTP